MIFSNKNQLVSRDAQADTAGAGLTEFTPEQRVGLTMTCVPLLRALRSRILLYSMIWSVAGIIIMSLAIPAICVGSFFLTLTALIYGGCLLFFSVVRMIESRSLAGLTEIGRSGFRRNVWMCFNGAVCLTAFISFIVSLVKPDWLTPWMAIPVSLFAMLVSISPVWEWWFVHRVVAGNRGLLEDFCRSLSLRYTRPEEMTILPLIVDALYFLERLEGKGVLRRESYAAIRNELIGLEGFGPSAPAAAPAATTSAATPAVTAPNGVVAATRPW